MTFTLLFESTVADPGAYPPISVSEVASGHPKGRMEVELWQRYRVDTHLLQPFVADGF